MATHPWPPPPDPDREDADAHRRLVQAFRMLGFMETQADLLASAFADPVTVGWWLKQGASHDVCLRILI